MTPEEAILQMNLLNHDFFVFYNPDLGAVDVVYRRKDGNYGLLSLHAEVKISQLIHCFFTKHRAKKPCAF
jgi:hypothetical protein